MSVNFIFLDGFRRFLSRSINGSVKLTPRVSHDSEDFSLVGGRDEAVSKGGNGKLFEKLESDRNF